MPSHNLVAFLAAPSRATDPTAELLLAAAYKAFDGKRFSAAKELYDEIVQRDNVCEAGFLGLALAFHRMEPHSPIAHRYGAQAATINRFLDAGSRAGAYADLLSELAPRPATPKPPLIEPEVAWYRALARHHPTRASLSDMPGFDAGNGAANGRFDEYFLAGFVPPAPIVGPTHDIATIGSCFATHIARYLHAAGRRRSKTANAELQYDNIFIDDEFFNTFILREAFEMAFAERADGRNWRDDATAQAGTRAILFNKEHIRAVLGAADVYILTLGLAEIWYDKIDGTVFPSGLNIDEFDANRHGFRVSTPNENLANLSHILDLIRIHRGDVPVIVTLSPVPLAATFRPMNCVAANSVSKAILRVAIDGLLTARADDRRLFYFPSYEIVTNYFVDPFTDDRRHVREDVVVFVMKTFERIFLAAPG